MRTCEELRQQLVQIKENNWKVPEDVDLDALITDMLRFIGHADGELRDGLIYIIFLGGSFMDNSERRYARKEAI